jgi:hypothetical protein
MTIVKAPEPVAPPPPAIDRRRVVLRERSRWREPDGLIRTGGRHAEVMLPADTAERALRNRLVIDPSSEVATRLRQSVGVEYQPFAPIYPSWTWTASPSRRRRHRSECRSSVSVESNTR